MPQFSHAWHLGTQWFWIPLGLLAASSPLLFWRGHRLRYLAGWSALLLLGAGWLWIRNPGADERLAETFWSRSPAEVDSCLLFVESRGTGLEIDCTLGAGQASSSSPKESRGSEGSWSRSLLFPGQVRYPEFPAPKFNLWGVEGYWSRQRRPGLSISLCAVAVPNWLAMLIFVVPIAFYASQFRRRREAARWLTTGCCSRCGYLLNGLPEPVRCPECGTPKPTPPADSKLSTATETQGKPA